jgi:hypothetical protein
MKKLCIALLLVTPFSFADWGDVYYCQMTHFSDINIEGKQKNYKLEKFQFKLDKEQNSMIFGKGGWFNDSSKQLNWILSSKEKWRAGDEYDRVTFHEGKFLYSIIAAGAIATITANCDKF